MHQAFQVQSASFRQHRVILHRSEAHQDRLEEVVSIVARVIGVLTIEQVRIAVLTTFTVGKAVVIECFKEIAEHYEASLKEYGLTVTLEEVK